MQAEREAQENVGQSLPEGTLWVRFVFVDHAGIPKTKAVYRDSFTGRARATRRSRASPPTERG